MSMVYYQNNFLNSIRYQYDKLKRIFNIFTVVSWDYSVETNPTWYCFANRVLSF